MAFVLLEHFSLLRDKTIFKRSWPNVTANKSCIQLLNIEESAFPAGRQRAAKLVFSENHQEREPSTPCGDRHRLRAHPRDCADDDIATNVAVAAPGSTRLRSPGLFDFGDGDLPVDAVGVERLCRLPKLEMFLNLKTAKTFDLEVPPTLLARADEPLPIAGFRGLRLFPSK